MIEALRLSREFEENRAHLRSVAYRMLGSLSDADDAVQEAWLRLNRSDVAGIHNLGGWLTAAVARVCLDMLRARKRRREESIREPAVPTGHAGNPEQEALLADSVGVALLVLLERLTPAERLAFVLHDIFAVSFEEIAAVLGRSPAAARQLASRARRRVQGKPGSVRLAGHRRVVDAFLAALRSADIGGLLEVLDPDVIVHVDQAGVLSQIRGARTWAENAVAYAKLARSAQPALVNGAPGAVFAPRGRLYSVLRFTIAGGKITIAEVIVNSARFPQLKLGALPA
jgi:RNA polymerase sigma-70 factor (ECF subfamily)